MISRPALAPFSAVRTFQANTIGCTCTSIHRQIRCYRGFTVLPQQSCTFGRAVSSQVSTSILDAGVAGLSRLTLQGQAVYC